MVADSESGGVTLPGAEVAFRSGPREQAESRTTATANPDEHTLLFAEVIMVNALDNVTLLNSDSKVVVDH